MTQQNFVSAFLHGHNSKHPNLHRGAPLEDRWQARFVSPQTTMGMVSIVIIALLCSFQSSAQDTMDIKTYRMGQADTIKTTTRQSFAKNPIKVKTYRMGDVDTITTSIPDDSLKSTISGNEYSLLPPEILKRRQRLVGLTSIGLYTGALLALNQAWYANYKRSAFHTFNDNKEWLQVDKVGHAWSAYQLSRLTFGAWKWSGVSEKKAVLYAGLSGPGFMTVIEVLDGFSSEWG